MIRPVLERPAHGGPGRLVWTYDVRIPVPLGSAPCRPVGVFTTAEACPEGRHTWDAIETTRDEYLDDTEVEEGEERIRFRLVLTCTACGLVERRAGVVEETSRTRVAPVPLTAKGLLAQMVDPGWRSLRGDRDTSTWVVHDVTGAVVGAIVAEHGRRGAVRHVGRLSTWPAERPWVRGATPLAVPRALARALAADTTAPRAVEPADAHAVETRGGSDLW